jgi:hypothetical protein
MQGDANASPLPEHGRPDATADAALMAHCREWREAQAAVTVAVGDYMAVEAACWGKGESGGDAMSAAEERVDAAHRRVEAAMKSLVGTPARTLGGVAAKLGAAVEWADVYGDDGEIGMAFLRAALDDVRGLL